MSTKKWFTVLRNCVRVSLENVLKVIVCCAVLDSVSKQLDDIIEYEDTEGISYKEEVEENQDESVGPRCTETARNAAVYKLKTPSQKSFHENPHIY